MGAFVCTRIVEVRRTNQAYDSDMKDISGSRTLIPPGCCVLHCLAACGSAEWRTNTAVPYWSIEWAVCSFHYWQLDDGYEYASVTEAKPSTKRWLLMGDDLVNTGSA